jgi:hypothetical protein
MKTIYITLEKRNYVNYPILFHLYYFVDYREKILIHLTPNDLDFLYFLQYGNDYELLAWYFNKYYKYSKRR